MSKDEFRKNIRKENIEIYQNQKTGKTDKTDGDSKKHVMDYPVGKKYKDVVMKLKHVETELINEMIVEYNAILEETLPQNKDIPVKDGVDEKVKFNTEMNANPEYSH